jgi:hypothetical protein
MSEEEVKKAQELKKRDSTYGNTLAILLTEILFIILPLVVLGIVFSFKGRVLVLLHTPEWSLISAILFGQTMIKVIIAALTVKDMEWQRIVFAVALVLVVGLVPSLLVLTLVITSDPPSRSLVATQITLFVLSIIVFFGLGGAMQNLLVERESSSALNN